MSKHVVDEEEARKGVGEVMPSESEVEQFQRVVQRQLELTNEVTALLKRGKTDEADAKIMEMERVGQEIKRFSEALARLRKRGD